MIRKNIACAMILCTGLSVLTHQTHAGIVGIVGIVGMIQNGAITLINLASGTCNGNTISTVPKTILLKQQANNDHEAAVMIFSKNAPYASNRHAGPPSMDTEMISMENMDPNTDHGFVLFSKEDLAEAANLSEERLGVFKGKNPPDGKVVNFPATGNKKVSQQ